MKVVDIDYLIFNRKSLIGKYLVEFQSYGDNSMVHSVGQITEIVTNDMHIQLKTDTHAWCAIVYDVDPKPRIELYDDNLMINHVALGIRYQILMR